MKEYLEGIADDKKARLAEEAAKEKRIEKCKNGGCEKSAPSNDDDMITVRSTDHTGMVSEK